MSGRLLDTHVLPWWLADDAKPLASMHASIAAAEGSCSVSSTSICEIGIKRAIGKLDAPEGLGRVIVGEGFLPLPINFAHAEAAGRLPLVRRDPFDRMLIAQPLMKSLVIATVGTVFDGFDVGIPAKQ